MIDGPASQKATPAHQLACIAGYQIITSNDVPSCRVYWLTMMWSGVLVCMNLNACEPFRVSLTKTSLCVPVISLDAGRSQIDPSSLHMANFRSN